MKWHVHADMWCPDDQVHVLVTHKHYQATVARLKELGLETFDWEAYKKLLDSLPQEDEEAAEEEP